jgi:Ca2+-binding RTX toxin-like protein
MPIFQISSQITLDYRGSALARAVGDFTGDPGLELLFGGPKYTTAFVNEAQPFKLLGVSASGQISDLSASLPAGAAAVHARELIAADLNGDGKADAFSFNHGFDNPAFPGEPDDLFLSSGGGPLTAGGAPNLSDFAHSGDVGDIDGDGDLDLIVGNFGNLGDSQTGPYFLLNNGQGVFTKAANGLSGAALPQLTSTKLVDVDRDGDIDLVGGNHGGASAGWVWLNDGRGMFTNDASRALPGGLFDRAINTEIAALDFDSDGDQDLILGQTRQEPFYSGSGLQFLANDGTGRFTDVTAQRFAGQDTALAWLDRIHVVDMNGDGHKDLVIARPQGGGMTSIALNDGAGRFIYAAPSALGVAGGELTPLDFDLDGRVDLISFSRDIPTDGPLAVSVYRNTGFISAGVTDGADLALGGAGRDAVEAGGGDDTLLGGGGEDFLRGGDGNDRIAGGDAFDDTHGNMGNDTISGGLGDDWTVGGKDNDLLFGDAGGDLVYGNIGADTCEGGDGNDVVRGGQDNDLINGGGGADYVSGDKGSDTVTGGAGADIFHTFGDAGVDRVTDFSLAEGDRVQVDPGTQYTVSQVGADTVISMTGGGQMTLVGVQMSSLTAGWIFGA